MKCQTVLRSFTKKINVEMRQSPLERSASFQGASGLTSGRSPTGLASGSLQSQCGSHSETRALLVYYDARSFPRRVRLTAKAPNSSLSVHLVLGSRASPCATNDRCYRT